MPTTGGDETPSTGGRVRCPGRPPGNPVLSRREGSGVSLQEDCPFGVIGPRRDAPRSALGRAVPGVLSLAPRARLAGDRRPTNVRAVLIAQVPAAVPAFYGMLREHGHEPVALITTREHAERYEGELGALLRETPSDLDVVIPSGRSRMAPLLRALEPDVVFCAGFPWKIPAEAIAVPKHGIVNGHPSLLPKYRGPSPVSWAIREGEDEIGFTFHYMDAELDTGNVLAQMAVPLGDERSWDELIPKLGAAVGELFPRVLERLENDDPGDPQPEGGSYHSFFELEYAWIDWSRTAVEIERQVRAWGFHSPVEGDRGALAVIDGETVRVLRVALEETGGTPVECADGTLWIVETEPA